jgi:hypothetical protein
MWGRQQKPLDMNDLENKAFISLFKACFQKCFGFAFSSALSETESKHLGNTIFEATGLVIGAKSLKNYSAYIANQGAAKQENPSTATLDTMARYILDAPYTDEIKRKDKENHFPWWFQYKNTIAIPAKNTPKNKRKNWPVLLITAMAVAIVLLLMQLFRGHPNEFFTDNFHSLREDSLIKNGWMLQSKDENWWRKRDERSGCLSLYTLRGDNWPDAANAPVIKNLLLRKISGDCFAVEIHLADFIPKENWQQAGMLLMEDTGFASKTVRLSLAFNDFFGGFDRPKEIIIQGVSSGGKDINRPEEIAHIAVFNIPDGAEALVHNNLQYSALRIEKTGTHFRFLYSTSPVENFAFKEAFVKDLPIKPKYIGLFALQGFVNDTNYIPAHVTFFSILNSDCEK